MSPALGRTFLPGEDDSGHAQVVILSHGLWQRRFAADPNVVGKAVFLNGQSHTVVGVMPSSYRLGYYGPQLWTALVFAPESVLPEARENRSLSVLARLKSGVSVETAGLSWPLSLDAPSRLTPVRARAGAPPRYRSRNTWPMSFGLP